MLGIIGYYGTEETYQHLIEQHWDCAPSQYPAPWNALPGASLCKCLVGSMWLQIISQNSEAQKEPQKLLSDEEKMAYKY